VEMTGCTFRLGKTGVLEILLMLKNKEEARFGQFIKSLSIPRRSIAIRLLELQEVEYIRRQDHVDGLSSVAFRGYVLTQAGTRLVNGIGIRALEYMIRAERGLKANAGTKTFCS